MNQTLYSILDELARVSHVDRALLAKARGRIDQNPKRLIQSTNPEDHFCVFFLPYRRASNSIYLVHHKKADDWIPPGGHIEEYEHPVDTVKREFREELGRGITDDKLELFDIDNKIINDPRQVCDMHWHVWYLVHTDVNAFNWDPREFYDAGWFSLEPGMRKIKQNESYKKVIRKLVKY